MNTKPTTRIDTGMILKIAAMSFFLVPFLVLLHELTHVVALELGGISAQLKGLALGMPVFPPGFSWDFESLRIAQAHYHAKDSAFVIGALAAPIFTLLAGYIALWAFTHWKHIVFAVISLSAIAARMANVVIFAPRIIDGTANTSDEIIAAHFMGWPLWSFFIPSMALYYLCFFLLMKALPKERRVVFLLSAFVGGFIGYFSVETLVNVYIFHLTTWTR